METWRLLAGISVMLVLWFGVTLALGDRPGPGDLVVAVVFAGIGLSLGERLSARLARRGSDE